MKEMKRLIIAITLLSFLLINPAGSINNAVSPNNPINSPVYLSGLDEHQESLTQCTMQFEDSIPIGLEESKRGCCSWHEGVCDCSPSGRVICCDGTLSPSCRCD